MGAACSVWCASAGATMAVRCRADCLAGPLRLLVPCSAACLEPARAWFPACAATWLRQLAGRNCLETAVRRSSAHSAGTRRGRMVRVALLAARRFYRPGVVKHGQTRTVPAPCRGQCATLMAALVHSGRATRSPGAWGQSQLPGCGASHRHDPCASHTLNGKIMMVLAGARLPALLAAGGHSWFLSGMITGKISY